MTTPTGKKSFRDFAYHARSIGFCADALLDVQEDYQRRREWDEPTEPKRTTYFNLTAKEKEERKKRLERLRIQNERSAAQARMRHKGTVPKRDGKPVFEENNGEVIFQGVPGQIYFVRCPNNARYYRTVYIRQHHLTKEPMGMVSQEVFGDPPSGMKEMSPLAVTRLMRVKNPF